MSTRENKELVRRIWKEWSAVAGDAAKVRPLFDKYCAPNSILHDLSRGNVSREQWIESDIMLVSAFPDLSFTIDDMLAEGERVVSIYTLQGTHKRTYMGIPATGKQISVKGIEIVRIDENIVIEVWAIIDALGMATQLGVIH